MLKLLGLITVYPAYGGDYIVSVRSAVISIWWHAIEIAHSSDPQTFCNESPFSATEIKPVRGINLHVKRGLKNDPYLKAN